MTRLTPALLCVVVLVVTACATTGPKRQPSAKSSDRVLVVRVVPSADHDESTFRRDATTCDGEVRKNFPISAEYVQALPPGTDAPLTQRLFGVKGAQHVKAVPVWAMVLDGVLLGFGVPVVPFSAAMSNNPPAGETDAPIQAFGECLTKRGYVMEIRDLLNSSHTKRVLPR